MNPAAQRILLAYYAGRRTGPASPPPSARFLPACPRNVYQSSVKLIFFVIVCHHPPY
jgi:hypothetical protein